MKRFTLTLLSHSLGPSSIFRFRIRRKYLQWGYALPALFVMSDKGQETVIVGAGDSACEEASYLANLCTKVTMLVRRDNLGLLKSWRKELGE